MPNKMTYYVSEICGVGAQDANEKKQTEQTDKDIVPHPHAEENCGNRHDFLAD